LTLGTIASAAKVVRPRFDDRHTIFSGVIRGISPTSQSSKVSKFEQTAEVWPT